MQARILEVRQLFMQRSGNGLLTIASSGTVTTSGWCCGELQPRVYIHPPVDGVWDWDFVATAPTGIVLNVISPIAAQTDPFMPPDWMRGVRVHAATNVLEQASPLASALKSDAVVQRDPGDVFPWVVAGEVSKPVMQSASSTEASQLDDLRGKSLRVYRTGDAITKDFRQDRFNCELDPQSSIIVSAWIG
jgi:hypothetical protein